MYAMLKDTYDWRPQADTVIPVVFVGRCRSVGTQRGLLCGGKVMQKNLKSAPLSSYLLSARRKAEKTISDTLTHRTSHQQKNEDYGVDYQSSIDGVRSIEEIPPGHKQNS
ncbi:hypothetical protein EVAR_23574_1 [Eumeta japonica]|uniref:Uncharacterized protein n=1 Tax=Eumeta variegata TaxID=151549 RepID=A0A4C1WYL7_EUMVA|nr:hypothetical protein EVAR_23574_1 [Eumeta japonica]